MLTACHNILRVSILLAEHLLHHLSGFEQLKQSWQLFPGAGMQADGACVLLGDKDREVVRLAGQVLAAACAMDLHSALQTAQASMHSQQVIGLVEEVSLPLALPTPKFHFVLDLD